MVVLAVGVLREFISIVQNMLMICGVFCVPATKNRKAIVCGWIILIGMCFGDIWIGYHNFYVLTFRVYVLPSVVLLWTTGKLFRRLAMYICGMMYLHMPYLCIDLFSEWITGKTITELENTGIYPILRGVLTIALIGLLVNKVRENPEYGNALLNLPTKYFLIGSVCCFAASMVQHYIEDVSMIDGGNADQRVVIIGCMVLVSGMFYILGVGVVALDILYKKYKAESTLKDEYLHITREYVRMVRENARETRKMRHDLQAHIGSLWYYMERREYQKAEEYLCSMREHMSSTFTKMVSVNHEIVDAVLLEQQTRAKSLNIQWRVEGSIPETLQIGDFDLCTMFYNLLSNSVEACGKLPREERIIHLSIRNLGNYLVIELENPTEGRVELKNIGTVTSKEDAKSHGYGIANVLTVVEKNHGQLSFESGENRFLVRVVFELNC